LAKLVTIMSSIKHFEAEKLTEKMLNTIFCKRKKEIKKLL